jgi:hypothetical protein
VRTDGSSPPPSLHSSSPFASFSGDSVILIAQSLENLEWYTEPFRCRCALAEAHFQGLPLGQRTDSREPVSISSTKKPYLFTVLPADTAREM